MQQNKKEPLPAKQGDGPQPGVKAKPLVGAALAVLCLVIAIIALPKLFEDKKSAPPVAPPQQAQAGKPEPPKADGKRQAQTQAVPGPQAPAAQPKQEKALTPEQIEAIKRARQKAVEEAEAQFAKMKVDPALAKLEVGFIDREQLYTLSMDLAKVIKGVLVGGNLCRLKGNGSADAELKMEIVTKDQKILIYSMKRKEEMLLVQGMVMKKLKGEGQMSFSAARAAFYLMNFMVRL